MLTAFPFSILMLNMAFSFKKIALPEGLKFKNTNVLVATWFGAGLLRPAPGTIGTLAAIPPGFLISYFLGGFGLLIAALFLLVVGTIAASFYGRKSGQKDDQSIVVDEVVGLWIAAIPAGTTLGLWIAAFLLFRLFDIWKPWPASYFDKRGKSGFDVMMDDVVAGIFAMMGVSIGAASLLLNQ